MPMMPKTKAMTLPKPQTPNLAKSLTKEIKGPKGDKGDRGEAGNDGKNGLNGLNGLDGRDGMNGRDGQNGQDGSPDTGIDIVKKINDLPKNAYSPKIDAFHIANLPNAIKQFTPPTIYAPGRGGAGGAGSINFSGGTTSGNLASITFADSNGVSFGLNGGTLTATVATNYQSAGAYLTTAALSQDSSLYRFTSQNSQLVFSSAALNLTNISATFNSNAISLSVAAAAGQTDQTMGLYMSSNTYLTSSGTVDARSMTFRGDKSITVGYSNGEVAFSVGAYITTAALSQDSSLYRFTSADSQLRFTSADSQLQFTSANSNFVFASAAFAGTSASGTIASNGISVSIGPYITTAMLSNAVTLSNIRVSGGTTSNLLSAITFADGNGVSFGLDGSTMTASVAAAGGGTLSYYKNIDVIQGINDVFVPNSGSTHYIVPFELQNNLSVSFIRMPINMVMTSTSWATSNTAQTGGFTRQETYNFVLYTRGVGASSMSLQSYTSTSGGLSWGVSYSIASTQMSSTYGISYNESGVNINTTFGVSQSTNSYRLYTSVFSNFNGGDGKYMDNPFALSLPAGQYWLGIGGKSNTSTNGFTSTNLQGLSNRITVMGISHGAFVIAGLGQATNLSTLHFLPGLGSWSTNSHGITTASIPMTQISTLVNHVNPFIQLMRIA